MFPSLSQKAHTSPQRGRRAAAMWTRAPAGMAGCIDRPLTGSHSGDGLRAARRSSCAVRLGGTIDIAPIWHVVK